MGKKPKRVLIMADLHCGHVVGLTPPAWQLKPNHENPKIAKYAKIQNALWQAYRKMIRRLKPVDVLIVNGDVIDGKGPKSGGTEQITLDREEQAIMAARCIQEVGSPTVCMTYGTSYHTGADEDWENEVCDRVKNMGSTKSASIGAHETIDVNGLVFDVKHHVGGSQIPHGRHTATAREMLWNKIWAEKGQRPKADVIVRSHVHYFQHCGWGSPRWLGITTPALQGLGSKYGARRVSGTVDFGVVYFDITNKEDYAWGWDIEAGVDAQHATIMKV